MNQLVRAESGVQVFIWILILAIWGVAQALGRNAKKNPRKRFIPPPMPRQPRPPQPRAPQPIPQPLQSTANDMEQELEQFLRSIGVATPKAAPPPPPQPQYQPPQPQYQPPAPPPPPVARQPTPSPLPPRRKQVKVRAKPGPQQVAAAARIEAAMRAPRQRGGKDILETEMDSYEEFVQSATISATRHMLVDISGVAVRSLRLAGTRHKVSDYRPDWKGPEDIRKAVVSHLIIGPPPSISEPQALWAK